MPPTSTPAGWYPDPANAAHQRYWDGAQWTEHVAAASSTGAASVTAQTVSETASERNRKVGRWAMIVVGVQAVCLPLAFTFILTGFATIDFAESSSTTSSTGPSGFGGLMLALGFLISAPLQFTGIAVLVLLLMWSYRLAQNGVALGLPAQRTPGWAIGGWFIPIANLWFPYESIRDTLPADRRPTVLRWWLAYLGIQFVTLPALLIVLPLTFTGLPFLVFVLGILITVGVGVLALFQVRWGFDVADRIHEGQCTIAGQAGRLTP